MKRTLTSLLVALTLTSTLGGCIVVSKKPGHRSQAVERRCEPAHHWEDGRCVHNGNKHKKSGTSNKDHRD